MTTSRIVIAEWALRISLGVMYLYSGYDLLTRPRGWTWAVPAWFQDIITSALPLESYLRLQGALELAAAALLLIPSIRGRWVQAVALLSAGEFLFILVFSPQFSITFRDIGLLGSSVALFFLAH